MSWLDEFPDFGEQFAQPLGDFSSDAEQGNERNRRAEGPDWLYFALFYDESPKARATRERPVPKITHITFVNIGGQETTLPILPREAQHARRPSSKKNRLLPSAPTIRTAKEIYAAAASDHSSDLYRDPETPKLWPARGRFASFLEEKIGTKFLLPASLVRLSLRQRGRVVAGDGDGGGLLPDEDGGWEDGDGGGLLPDEVTLAEIASHSPSSIQDVNAGGSTLRLQVALPFMNVVLPGLYTRYEVFEGEDEAGFWSETFRRALLNPFVIDPELIEHCVLFPRITQVFCGYADLLQEHYDYGLEWRRFRARVPGAAASLKPGRDLVYRESLRVAIYFMGPENFAACERDALNSFQEDI